MQIRERLHHDSAFLTTVHRDPDGSKKFYASKSVRLRKLILDRLRFLT